MDLGIGDLLGWLSDMWDALIETINNIIDWLLATIEAMLLSAYDLFLSSIATLINSLPLPDGSAITDACSSLPEGVGYFVAPLGIGQGLSLLFGAYFMRFLIRRLPLIG